MSNEFNPVEFQINLDRNFRDPMTVPCRRCGADWTPTGWNFHDLCELCFAEFDHQKMQGRWNRFFPGGGNPNLLSFEWVSDWLKHLKEMEEIEAEKRRMRPGDAGPT